MDLSPVFVISIVFVTIYKIFDLFVRRRKRLSIIDKISPENANIDFSKWAVAPASPDNRFAGLKWGALALGLGLGLFAYTMIMTAMPYMNGVPYMSETLCSGMVLTGGGFGLLIAFIVENSIRKSQEKKGK